MTVDRNTAIKIGVDKASAEYIAKRTYLLKMAAKYNPLSEMYKAAGTEPYHEKIYLNIHEDFLGGSYQKFQNLGMLHAYIEDILKDTGLPGEIKANLLALQAAVPKFENYLLADVTEAKIADSINKSKTNLMPANLLMFTIMVGNIGKGFDRMKTEAEKVAAQVNEIVAKEKEVEAKRKEIFVMMMKIIIGIFSSTLGDLVMAAVKNATPGGPTTDLAAILSAFPSEPIAQAPPEEAERRLKNALEKIIALSKQEISELVIQQYKEAFDELRKQAEKATLDSITREFSTADKEIHTQFDLLQPQLQAKLQELDFTQVQSPVQVLNVFAKDMIVPAVLTSREEQINIKISSLTPIQKQAHIIEKGVAPERQHELVSKQQADEASKQILNNMAKNMRKQFFSRIFSSRFHKEANVKVAGYHKSHNKDDDRFKAFTPMIRGKDEKTIIYYPHDISSLANYFDPTFNKNEMRIGGQTTRELLFDALTINPDLFGLKRKFKFSKTFGKEADKGRIRDYWRSEQILTTIFQHHAPTLPTNKDPATFALDVLHIMHADVFFKQHHSNYPTDEKVPVNSPLHLFLNTDELMTKLKDPEVKKEMNKFLEGNPLKFVLRMLTDVNSLTGDDGKRMRYALTNILKVLAAIDDHPNIEEKKANIDAITKSGEAYIVAQLQFSAIQRDLNKLIKSMEADPIFNTFEHAEDIYRALNVLIFIPSTEKDRTHATSIILKNLAEMGSINPEIHIDQYIESLRSITQKAEKAKVYEKLQNFREQADAHTAFPTPEEHRKKLQKQVEGMQQAPTPSGPTSSEPKAPPKLDISYPTLWGAPTKTALEHTTKTTLEHTPKGATHKKR